MKVKNIFSIVLVLIMLSNIVSAVEIRGTVVSGTYKWTAQNFAGFFYDLDKNQSSETLNITDLTDRTIPSGSLVYITTKVPVNYSYSKDTGKSIFKDVKEYYVMGWQAEKWVALGGKPNKLVKLITELEGNDKISISSGGTSTLGSGYILKINAIDANANPRQAWISVLKDGKVIDDAVMRQDEIYNLKKSFGGETDVLVLSAYVSSIFDGGENQLVQLKYVWLIDENTFTEVKSGSKFGKLEVFEISDNNVILKNTGSVTLTRNSRIELMGNMKFKVADNSDLRFYPYVDTVDTTKIQPTPTPTITPMITPIPCTPEIKRVEVEKIVYVTPEPTTPTPTEEPKKSPGFESIFGVFGIVVIIFILSKKK